MEFSTAEIFLLAWATTATFLCAYLAHQVKRHLHMGLMLTRTLIGVAAGKIKVDVKDGQMKFEDIEETN